MQYLKSFVFKLLQIKLIQLQWFERHLQSMSEISCKDMIGLLGQDHGFSPY